jgi:serine/threonine protein kinase
MEYLEGPTLAAHLAAGTIFSLEQVLEIGAQTAGILAAVHARGVAHRALAAEHLHICPDSSEPSGLRVALRGVGELDDADAGAADLRADLRGLGRVLVRLLAGRRVQPARPALPARDQRADVPPPLDALVHRMVARPDDGPASMADVERQLRMLLLGQQLVDAVKRSRQALRRRWSAQSWLAAAAVLLAAGLVLLW